MIDLQVDISEFVKLEEDFDAFSQKLDSKKVMGEVAVDQIARIKTRTLGGKDFKGNAFIPYSEFSKQHRQNPPEGQSARPVNTVDLFFSGQMFGAMDWEEAGESVRLFFNDTRAAEKAYDHHHGYLPRRLPARPFFEISKDEEAEIRDQIETSINEVRETFFK